MNFGQVLEELKEGKKVSRKGWNGKGMWLCLINHEEYNISAGLVSGKLKRAPFIAMKTADDSIVPWFPSQTDLLAEDWNLNAEES